MVFGAAGIKSGAALRTGIIAGQILGNRQGAMTLPAENGSSFAFVSAPTDRLMAGDRFVAVDARIKFVAALEPNGDDVAIGVVMLALCLLVDAQTTHRSRRFHRHLCHYVTDPAPYTKNTEGTK